MNNVKEEAVFTCQMCFHSDLNPLNLIVFCDVCGLGTHQLCYGITDVEIDFVCHKCLEFKSPSSLTLNSVKNRTKLSKQKRVCALKQTVDDI
jgi:hypothetical protein